MELEFPWKKVLGNSVQWFEKKYALTAFDKWPNSKCRIHGKIREPKFLGNMYIYVIKYSTPLVICTSVHCVFFPTKFWEMLCAYKKKTVLEDCLTSKISSGIPRPPTSSCMGFNIYLAYLTHKTCKAIVTVNS